jgi:hypothetical protein
MSVRGEDAMIGDFVENPMSNEGRLECRSIPYSCAVQDNLFVPFVLWVMKL